MARDLTEIDVGDDAAAWQAAGFTVPADGAVRVGRVTINLVGADGERGIRGWGFGPADGGDGDNDDRLDGIPTRTTNPPAGDLSTGSHPNGATVIDHVVVLSPDGGRTVERFEAFGLDARRTRDTDQYGLPMRQTFFRAGEAIIELIAPHEPTDDSPASFFGLAYTVTDLDATTTLLGEAIGTPKDAVQPGRRIVTLRHKGLGMSVPTAFMSPDPR